MVALAALRIGRPVALELTREEQFAATTTRHPMRVTVTIGARRDGTLTAIRMTTLADTGAYGNHAAGVLFHSCGEAVSLYRCPNKRIDAQAAYTNTVPAGAFRGYGLSQTAFAVESTIDEVARALDMDPLELRRRTIIGPGDSPVSLGDPDDVVVRSYGALQCLDLVEQSFAAGRGLPVPRGPQWRVGTGVALTMLDTVPPGGHHSHSRIREQAGGGFVLHVGTAEFGNGTTTVHRQLAAHQLGVSADDIEVVQSDTDGSGHDTGAFGSTGSVVAGTATLRAATALAGQIAAGGGDGTLRSAEGSSDGRPRSVSFTAQGFRVAVDVRTGEVRILHSVQAVDAGTVLNPMQCRGQVEGGAAQALGAALHEHVDIDGTGTVTTRTLRNYHVPTLADVPRTEVHFADTSDPLGPFGAKPMSEAPFNPVAPALANAVRDATGVRITTLPLTRDRVLMRLQDAPPSTASGGQQPGQFTEPAGGPVEAQ